MYNRVLNKFRWQRITESLKRSKNWTAIHQLLRFSKQIMLSDPKNKSTDLLSHRRAYPDQHLPLQHRYVSHCRYNVLCMLWTTLAKWNSLPLATNTSFILCLREASHYQTAVPNIKCIVIFISDESWEHRQWLSTSERPSCWSLLSPPSLSPPAASKRNTIQQTKKRMENCLFLYWYWTKLIKSIVIIQYNNQISL